MASAVNLPPLDAIEGIQLTRIGSKLPFAVVYTDDLAPLFKAQAGKPGISFAAVADATPEQQQDEAVWLAKRHITISPFSGQPGETAQPAAAKALLGLPYQEHQQ